MTAVSVSSPPTAPQRAHSFYEANARERVAGILDPGSFEEYLGPCARARSPHLEQLDVPAAFDDGLVVGSGRLAGRTVLIAAQEGAFMGGAVGEVHGAKLAGLLERARRTRPEAVLLLPDSGGVRLHEANAGLIAISEIMRAVLAARVAGVPVLALIGSGNGCFGGMGIVARCCDRVIVSEEGRLALSGPEVIETVRGVEEFDSRDRALVWRTTGGKHRFLLGEADALVDDAMSAFREAALAALPQPRALDLAALTAAHEALVHRRDRYGACADALDIWRLQGIHEVEQLPLLGTEDFRAAVAGRTL